jgi:hypothetical protein
MVCLTDSPWELNAVFPGTGAKTYNTLIVRNIPSVASPAVLAAEGRSVDGHGQPCRSQCARASGKASARHQAGVLQRLEVPRKEKSNGDLVQGRWWVGGDRQGCRKRPLAVRLQATKSRSTEARDAGAFLTRETTLSQPSSAGDAAMASIANAAAPLSRHPCAVGLLSLVSTSRKGPLVGRSLVWPCNVSES